MQRDTWLSRRVYGFAGRFWYRHSRVSGEKYPIITLCDKVFFCFCFLVIWNSLSLSQFDLKCIRLLHLINSQFWSG